VSLPKGRLFSSNEVKFGERKQLFSTHNPSKMSQFLHITYSLTV